LPAQFTRTTGFGTRLTSPRHALHTIAVKFASDRLIWPFPAHQGRCVVTSDGGVKISDSFWLNVCSCFFDHLKHDRER
jgi:hypothetical protein